jgi:septum site-determining protein MinC
MQPKIEIKGVRDGILVTFGEGSWDELKMALIEQLDQQANFLRGGKMAIDVGNQVIKAAELGSLRNEISERGISLWAVLSNSPVTETTAQTLGLATRLSKPRPEMTRSKIETRLNDGNNALLIQKTLRSGFSVHHPGHVIILGDVNPGAEIIASGSIVIWGRLRGLVHAGAEGDESSTVSALDLSPTQLRIAGQIAALTPQKRSSRPEIVRLLNGKVVSETWEPKKK